MRLFIAAILHLPIQERDGRWRALRPTTTDVIAWLHPNGWKNRRRDWHRFPAALEFMRKNLGYITVPGIGHVAVLIPTVIPQRPTDPFVEFTIRIPPAASGGIRIDWPTLCQYGTKSAALYRAYLSVMAFLDRSAHHGHPITRLIGAPLTDEDGKLQRRNGGLLIRSESDLINNPSARFVPHLSIHQATAMIGYDPNSKQRRHDTRLALRELHDHGVIELLEDRIGLRLFGPHLLKN